METDKKERKLTVNLEWANIFSIFVMVIIGIPTVYLWYILWGKPDIFPSKESMPDEQSAFFIKMLVFLIVFIAGIFIHELIHGVTWAHYAKSRWKSISFGIIWKMLAPYCHCSEPLQVRPYIIGALMPLIILGILPWAIGLCIGNIWVTVFGAFYIVAACGDILVVWKLRKENPNNLVLDHPTEAGCIIFEENQ